MHINRYAGQKVGTTTVLKNLKFNKSSGHNRSSRDSAPKPAKQTHDEKEKIRRKYLCGYNFIYYSNTDSYCCRGHNIYLNGIDCIHKFNDRTLNTRWEDTVAYIKENVGKIFIKIKPERDNCLDDKGTSLINIFNWPLVEDKGLIKLFEELKYTEFNTKFPSNCIKALKKKYHSRIKILSDGKYIINDKPTLSKRSKKKKTSEPKHNHFNRDDYREISFNELYLFLSNQIKTTK